MLVDYEIQEKLILNLSTAKAKDSFDQKTKRQKIVLKKEIHVSKGFYINLPNGAIWHYCFFPWLLKNSQRREGALEASRKKWGDHGSVIH